MSGHSKWSTIKHDKGVADAKRGKLFSRLAKAISIAVREGNSDDSETNPRLRLMVDKAKEANMPKENIKRAIDKGAGRIAGAAYEEVTYEGFGPHKIALIIECVTDSRNRTNSEIKSLFDKHEGVLGSIGSTNYFFDRQGYIEVKIPEGKNSDNFQLELIDLGAEDVKDNGNGRIQIFVNPTDTHLIAERLKEKGIEVVETEVAMVPNTEIELAESEFKQFIHFLDTIDDYEDVQRIYHNAKQI